jgi:RNA exonuclease 1
LFLKFAHPYAIDTSILYTNPGGTFCKSSLKMLSHQWLNRSIQVNGGSIVGHDSIEDAQAAMDLVKLKLKNGKVSYIITFRQIINSVFYYRTRF